MADISKCCNTKCEQRESCYRYRVKPDLYRQSYAPYDSGKDNCFVSAAGWDERCLIPVGALIKDYFQEVSNE